MNREGELNKIKIVAASTCTNVLKLILSICGQKITAVWLRLGENYIVLRLNLVGSRRGSFLWIRFLVAY